MNYLFISIFYGWLLLSPPLSCFFLVYSRSHYLLPILDSRCLDSCYKKLFLASRFLQLIINLENKDELVLIRLRFFGWGHKQEVY